MANGGKRSFSRSICFLLAIACLTLSACAAPRSNWRIDALNALNFARMDSADTILPEEYQSVKAAFSQAEDLMQRGEAEEADRFYQLAATKGSLLRKNVIARNELLLFQAGEANKAALEQARKRLVMENKAVAVRDAAAPAGMAGPTAMPAVIPRKTCKKPLPTIYLTFDDGPSPVTIPIAKYLKSEGIQATFFAVGQRIKGHEQLVRETIGNGHLVANHTFTHNARRLSAGPAALKDEIDRTGTLLDKLGGDGLLVRLPYGSRGAKSIHYRMSQLTEPAVQVVDWDIDSNDSRPLGVRNHGVITRSVLSQLKGLRRNNVVILFHDGAGHGETLVALKELVPKLKQEGYRFAGLSRDSKVVWVRKPKKSGLIAATKSDRQPKVPL